MLLKCWGTFLVVILVHYLIVWPQKIGFSFTKEHSLKNFDEKKERHLVGTKTLSQRRFAASKNVHALTSKLL